MFISPVSEPFSFFGSHLLEPSPPASTDQQQQEGLLEPPADSRGGFRFDSTCDDVKRWRGGLQRRFTTAGVLKTKVVGIDENLVPILFFVGGCFVG